MRRSTAQRVLGRHCCALCRKVSHPLVNFQLVYSLTSLRFSVSPTDLLLRLGEYDISTDKEPYTHLERRIQIIAPHPNFDPRTFEYDLALLRFYEPIRFQRNIIPICLPENNDTYVGRWATVTGWGRLHEGKVSSSLHCCYFSLNVICQF